jgi:glutamate mutase epsilon subunit
MKFNSVVNDNERKNKILSDKSSELTRLKEEVEVLRDKARERDAFSNKNKELLAKYYG